MLPPMGPTPLAASLMEYRQRTIGGALAKAAEFGYQGAMYAWESCVTGTDQEWWGTCGKFEHHITADIGNAIEQYWLATHDDHWLATYWPLIEAIAAFWTSRATPCNRGGAPHYCINHDMGPDERKPPPPYPPPTLTCCLS